jgi:hypothetical protein
LYLANRSLQWAIGEYRGEGGHATNARFHLKFSVHICLPLASRLFDGSIVCLRHFQSSTKRWATSGTNGFDAARSTSVTMLRLEPTLLSEVLQREICAELRVCNRQARDGRIGSQSAKILSSGALVLIQTSSSAFLSLLLHHASRVRGLGPIPRKSPSARYQNPCAISSGEQFM